MWADPGRNSAHDINGSQNRILTQDPDKILSRLKSYNSDPT